MDFKKYRWFFTSGKKLVVGGKNSEQNEALVKEMIKQENCLAFHTSSPGSPFSFIMSEKPSSKDIKETAIFTACFSHEWRKKSSKARVDVFESKDIFKSALMKQGTFGVRKKTKSIDAPLALYLSVQEGRARAVPFPAGKVKLIPGSMEKEKACEILEKMTDYKKEELLQALPSGAFKIIKKR